jgi:hypothetical protein
MGIPIEHEHTKDKDLATDIALQHLDEIPDYYTRLKKMEADAKKHHKKFKDVKEETKSGDQGLHDWFNKSKSSDGTKGWVQLGGKWSGEPCARQPGQTSTPKCGSSKMKRALSKDEEEAARRRKNRLDPNQPEKTGGAKPTNVRTEEMDLQEVKDKPGKGSGKKDACYHKVKSRYDVWPSAYASGALVKCRKVGADNWGTKSEEVKMIRYCPKCKKDETRDECKYGTKYWDMFSIPSKLNKEYHPNSPHPGNFPESYDHEYSMARSELETIISAAKRMKKKIGKGEGNLEAWVQSKITKAADYIDTAADYVDSGQGKVDEACWDGYEQEGMKKKGNKVVPNCVKKEGYSNWKEELKLVEGWPFGPNTVTPQNSPTGTKSVEQDKKYPARQNSQPVNVQYGSKGEKKITPMPAGQAGLMQYKYGSTWGMPQYQSYEPEGELVEYSNWREEIGLSEDWQKVNRQDKTDGLSKKAVDAYRREHPGSKLQTAVTEKKPKGKRAKRRASFCRRMKGMKSKLTSAKTARDPDSRINKALRRWNCN